MGDRFFGSYTGAFHIAKPLLDINGQLRFLWLALAFNDQGKFTPGGGKVGQSLAYRPAEYLLVPLGEFTAYCQPAVPQDLSDILQRW